MFQLLDRISIDEVLKNKYINTMNLEKELANMINLKNCIKHKEVLDYSFAENLERPNQFYKERNYGNKYSLFSENKHSQKITIPLLLEKLRFYKYKYQTNFISLKFIFLIVFELMQNLKKIKI